MRNELISSRGFSGRSFLMLQGPQSGFFKRLAQDLKASGARVFKINFCGGDVFHWGFSRSQWYTGNLYDWPSWIGQFMDKEAITDLLLYGDWRPFHWEAIRLAKYKGIRVWVFEEGYIREGFSTLEVDGVNGRSKLPKDPDEIFERASHVDDVQEPAVSNDLKCKIRNAVIHHAGNVLLFPVFFKYRTHRATNIFWELTGLIPRIFSAKKRREISESLCESFYQRFEKFFFFPLQLNADSQIQLYSPFSHVREAIAEVLVSFAQYAPNDTGLLIKNHPLDNGLINYSKFISSLATELGIQERVCFVEAGSASEMSRKSQGVVLVNSSVGMTALSNGCPVFCLGEAIYDIEGLTSSTNGGTLREFWINPLKPNKELVNAFRKVLKFEALIPGNFYCARPIRMASRNSVKRLSRLLSLRRVIVGSNRPVTSFSEKGVSCYAR